MEESSTVTEPVDLIAEQSNYLVDLLKKVGLSRAEIGEQLKTQFGGSQPRFLRRSLVQKQFVGLHHMTLIALNRSILGASKTSADFKSSLDAITAYFNDLGILEAYAPMAQADAQSGTSDAPIIVGDADHGTASNEEEPVVLTQPRSLDELLVEFSQSQSQ